MRSFSMRRSRTWNEGREIETLRTAKVSVDVAMYSFTDREPAAELVRLARSGVRVRVYRDSRESMQATLVLYSLDRERKC
jgi:phosphatidylserine/phosphatidylglycerophosphate/cardiolipin synthase-like enzyme